MTAARVLHIIQDMNIGGAQRSVMTLMKTAGHDARIVHPTLVGRDDVKWADVVVAHVWRSRKGDPRIMVPLAAGVDPSRLIVFNHDVEGRISARCAVVIVYSESAARRQVVEAPVRVLPGGVGLEAFRRVSATRRWDKVASLGRLSTLHEGKISPRTIAWWPDLPARRLLVGGAGPQLEVLRATFAATRMEFPGEIQPRLRAAFLRQIDLFCYQTEWHEESFGYVVLEAMAAGCVVVTEPRGALRELVVDDLTGVVVDGATATIERVTHLISDPRLCARLAESGLRAAAKYTSEAMQSRFADIVAATVSGTESPQI